jgi:hypothetical protein
MVSLLIFIANQAGDLSTLPSWALGGFVRPAKINPVISPRANSHFLDPMSGAMVKWEESDTFNPGATIKNGHIVVLYRSEDKTGVQIGTRTSRLGYAESSDGLHFNRHDKPVFFPAADNQRENEWPGGCEDPRIAVLHPVESQECPTWSCHFKESAQLDKARPNIFKIGV